MKAGAVLLTVGGVVFTVALSAGSGQQNRGSVLYEVGTPTSSTTAAPTAAAAFM